MNNDKLKVFRGALKTSLFKLAATALAASSQIANAGTAVPSDADSPCKISAVEFASWFTSGTVTPNGAVDPADSITFPNTPNCSFYKWSEQMFLWLTSPAPTKYGKPGRVFDSSVFYDVSPPVGGQRTLIPNVPGRFRDFSVRISQLGPQGKPVMFDNKGKMFTVVRPEVGPSGRPLVRNKAGQPIEIQRTQVAPDGKTIFLDKAGKAIDHQVVRNGNPRILDRSGKVIDFRRDKTVINGRQFFLDGPGNVIDFELGQADGSVLMAQNGSLVYYSLQVNDMFAYFLTGQKNGAITATKFPTSVLDLNQIKDFGLAHGKTFPDPNALAIELKSSWIETTLLTPLEVSKYVTITATIPTYTPVTIGGVTQWNAAEPKQAELALVGMHVVGSTSGGPVGHPEMLWATFEHVDNTPNATYFYNSTTTGGQKQVPPDTTGIWRFSGDPLTMNPNNQRMVFNGSSASIHPLTNETIGPSDILRVNPWGSPGTSAAKNTEVIAINRSVIDMLAPGDVRSNYIMTGTTWTIGGAPPSGGNQVGTNQMANTTMESFLQPSNCFSCHRGDMLGTDPGGGSTSGGLSHIYWQLKPLFP